MSEGDMKDKTENKLLDMEEAAKAYGIDSKTLRKNRQAGWDARGFGNDHRLGAKIRCDWCKMTYRQMDGFELFDNQGTVTFLCGFCGTHGYLDPDNESDSEFYIGLYEEAVYRTWEKRYGESKFGRCDKCGKIKLRGELHGDVIGFKERFPAQYWLISFYCEDCAANSGLLGFSLVDLDDRLKNASETVVLFRRAVEACLECDKRGKLEKGELCAGLGCCRYSGTIQTDLSKWLVETSLLEERLKRQAYGRTERSDLKGSRK